MGAIKNIKNGCHASSRWSSRSLDLLPSSSRHSLIAQQVGIFRTRAVVAVELVAATNDGHYNNWRHSVVIELSVESGGLTVPRCLLSPFTFPYTKLINSPRGHVVKSESYKLFLRANISNYHIFAERPVFPSNKQFDIMRLFVIFWLRVVWSCSLGNYPRRTGKRDGQLCKLWSLHGLCSA